MEIHTLRLVAFAILVFFTSCSTTSVSSNTAANGETTSKHDERKESKAESVEQTTDSPTTQLVDLIRRVSGVDVRGSHPNVVVYVRGGASKANPQSVLYVVDNNPMGNDYARVAEIVDMTRVKSVSVLKGGETAIYGKEGGGGVVLIKLKKIRED